MYYIIELCTHERNVFLVVNFTPINRLIVRKNRRSDFWPYGFKNGLSENLVLITDFIFYFFSHIVWSQEGLQHNILTPVYWWVLYVCFCHWAVVSPKYMYIVYTTCWFIHIYSRILSLVYVLKFTNTNIISSQSFKFCIRVKRLIYLVYNDMKEIHKLFKWLFITDGIYICMTLYSIKKKSTFCSALFTYLNSIQKRWEFLTK